MKLSTGALVVLSYLPRGPQCVSLRELAGQIFEGDRRLTTRGQVRHWIAELMRTGWIFWVYNSSWPAQQKKRYGIKVAYYNHAMRLLQEHDVPEHLDRNTLVGG